MTVNRYRVWFGKADWQSESIDAMNASDALIIATMNFKKNGFVPVKIEFEKQIERKN